MNSIIHELNNSITHELNNLKTQNNEKVFVHVSDIGFITAVF